MNSKNRLSLKQVIGLQNLDSSSEEFRLFKQIIERLNRTYKSHLKSMYGFKNKNGAVSLTALFVTYYNFLRSHSSLKYNPPIKLDFLDPSSTLPTRWATILNKAIDLDLAA